MPTSQQIARIQAKVLRYLTETADIDRREIVQDAAGVPDEEDWDRVASDVSCRVIDATRGRRGWMEVAQSDAMVDAYRIVFPVGTDVTENCRVIVGSRVYHVVEVLDDRTNAVDVQVMAKRIRGNDGS